jgi:hypothetical protein
MGTTHLGGKFDSSHIFSTFLIGMVTSGVFLTVAFTYQHGRESTELRRRAQQTAHAGDLEMNAYEAAE